MVISLCRPFWNKPKQSSVRTIREWICRRSQPQLVWTVSRCSNSCAEEWICFSKQWLPLVDQKSFCYTQNSKCAPLLWNQSSSVPFKLMSAESTMTTCSQTFLWLIAMIYCVATFWKTNLSQLFFIHLMLLVLQFIRGACLLPLLHNISCWSLTFPSQSGQSMWARLV